MIKFVLGSYYYPFLFSTAKQYLMLALHFSFWNSGEITSAWGGGCSPMAQRGASYVDVTCELMHCCRESYHVKPRPTFSAELRYFFLVHCFINLTLWDTAISEALPTPLGKKACFYVWCVWDTVYVDKSYPIRYIYLQNIMKIWHVFSKRKLARRNENTQVGTMSLSDVGKHLGTCWRRINHRFF